MRPVASVLYGSRSSLPTKHQHHLEGWLKPDGWALPLAVLLQWVWVGGLAVCICNKLPGDAGVVGPQTPF